VNFLTLKIFDFNNMITQYVIALGSNSDGKISFDIAIAQLEKWGDVLLSSVVASKDFTGKTDLIYHNAVVVMTLYEPIDHNGFNLALKSIEKKCGREHDVLKIDKTDEIKIPMDLDILAYYDDGTWHVIKKRLPFKVHEKKGLIEIAPFLLTNQTI
jgi:7,8-dihydro-6-hydroxymethylpterin-pyrophosphokinase (HPPK)